MAQYIDTEHSLEIYYFFIVSPQFGGGRDRCTFLNWTVKLDGSVLLAGRGASRSKVLNPPLLDASTQHLAWLGAHGSAVGNPIARWLFRILSVPTSAPFSREAAQGGDATQGPLKPGEVDPVHEGDHPPHRAPGGYTKPNATVKDKPQCREGG
ncbi:hypothetical protein KIL84_021162 [Mauremys mutica]|uniref:Uncharacterized protein n=1 Tax=Mauremys mutica TaxID=74926 RepID=A0A9D4AZQ6_9SAUR|nr:hypothetical protein KIL84_021162 [Mauremys mutica]